MKKTENTSRIVWVKPINDVEMLSNLSVLADKESQSVFDKLGRMNPKSSFEGKRILHRAISITGNQSVKVFSPDIMSCSVCLLSILYDAICTKQKTKKEKGETHDLFGDSMPIISSFNNRFWLAVSPVFGDGERGKIAFRLIENEGFIRPCYRPVLVRPFNEVH